jgi:hypothetical protein
VFFVLFIHDRASLKALPTPPPSTASTAEREKMRWENIFTRENVRSARVEWGGKERKIPFNAFQFGVN